MFPLLTAVGALANVGVGLYGMKRRKEERRAADVEFNQAKAQYQNLDTTNQFQNLQNPYEDLTVNQQAADFTAQQQNQGLANVMGNMSAAAGGSGIASLAQAMANQQSQNMQAASASIGQQEASNSAAAAQGFAQNQMAERQGAETARGIQRTQAVGELEMGQSRLNSIKAEQQAATNMMLGGIGQLTGVGLGMGQNAVNTMGDAATPLAQYMFGTPGSNILTGQSGN
jgi:hypothetical protein